jgi:amino acid transporter
MVLSKVMFSSYGGLRLTNTRRGLFEIHIFMIAIGAVIGLGFYVRTGAVYNLGGSAAVIYSFGVLGLVTSLVMHNLAKMLRAWPVPGALIVFVQKFVDEEIGLTIGILYW